MRCDLALLAGLALASCTTPQAATRDVAGLTVARSGVEAPRRDPGRMDELHPAVAERLREPLDADGAVSIALRQSPELQARLAQVDLAVAELWSARPPNPEVEMEALMDGGQASVLEVGAVMDIGALLRMPLMRRAAQAQLDSAELEAAADVLRYAYDTRVAFHRYQADLQLVELYRAAMETFLAAWEAAESMAEAGNLRQLDVAQNRAAYERSRIDVAQAELRALMSREQLQVLLGLDGRQTDWAVIDGFEAPGGGEPPPAPALERTAVDHSLVLNAQQRTLVAWSRRVGVERMRGALPEAHAGLFAEREEGEWSFGPAAGVAIPVFDQNQGAIGETRARLRIAQHELLQKAIRIRSLARRARATWLNAAERVRFYDETLLPARAEVLEQTLLQYNAMNVGVFQLLQARRAVIDAARERVEAMFDLWRASAQVELVVAGGEPPAMGGPDMSGEAMNAGGGDGGH
ncbi:MAG: TolC family protein [Deltaproteobacteria bacterium]|nr:TolC family protein [Deltaproteobacteria bacterium]